MKNIINIIIIIIIIIIRLFSLFHKLFFSNTELKILVTSGNRTQDRLLHV